MTTPTTPATQASPLRTIVGGLGWNSANQVVSVLVNLALTPLLVHRLGLAAYGTFAVVSSFRGLLSNLDGGLGPASSRYLAVYAGAGDRRRASALLVTTSCLLVLVLGAVGAVAAVLAPQLTLVLHATPHLRGQAATLLQASMPLLVASALQAVLARAVVAEHRWRFMSATSIAALAVYAALAVLLTGGRRGIMGLFWANVGMQATALAATAVGARHYLAPGLLGLLPGDELRPLLRYASRVQAAALSSSLGVEVDALLVGLLFPVGDVGLYSIGYNFATQLSNLPQNAVGPIAVTLSRTFGQEGLHGTLTTFARLQRLWVRAVAAFCVVGAVAAVVAIPHWLGRAERTAGVVAGVLLAGQAVQLLGTVMGELSKSVERPGLESRYLAVGAVVNVALTIPLALAIGMLGVPLGTAAGAVVSTLYFLHLAHREISVDLPSFLSEVPWGAVAVATVVTVALELLADRIAPTGVAGMAVCAVPAAVGLAAYGAVVLSRRARPSLGTA